MEGRQEEVGKKKGKEKKKQEWEGEGTVDKEEDEGERRHSSYLEGKSLINTVMHQEPSSPSAVKS